MLLTALFVAVEIATGLLFHSMALLGRWMRKAIPIWRAVKSLVERDAVNERLKRILMERYPSLGHVTVEVSVCADCAWS
jgi:Co/Zn/Cd efflux system component